jgi:hypothetical protein
MQQKISILIWCTRLTNMSTLVIMTVDLFLSMLMLTCEWGLHWNGRNSPKSQNGFAKFKYIMSQDFGASKVLQNKFILNIWDSLNYWFCQDFFKELKISWFESDLIPQIVEIVVKCHFDGLVIN